MLYLKSIRAHTDRTLAKAVVEAAFVLKEGINFFVVHLVVSGKWLRSTILYPVSLIVPLYLLPHTGCFYLQRLLANVESHHHNTLKSQIFVEVEVLRSIEALSRALLLLICRRMQTQRLVK